MSTGTKRPREQALVDAEAFKALFPPACYRRWEFAGSLRRGRPEVGDVEHVVIPAFGEVDVAGGLFAMRETVNLLWSHLDALERGSIITKHWYGGDGAPHRWGEKLRGCSFRGFAHEVFTTDADNWGARLVILTGPADYSHRVVMAFNRAGMYRQIDGQLIAVQTGEPVPVPDEETYLRLAGLPYLPPERRA